MDRTLLERHLASAERHAANGMRLIEHQERLIRELDRCGHDTGAARSMLATLRDTQRIHEQDVSAFNLRWPSRSLKRVLAARASGFFGTLCTFALFYPAAMSRSEDGAGAKRNAARPRS
jgi:hypothetical protein